MLLRSAAVSLFVSFLNSKNSTWWQAGTCKLDRVALARALDDPDTQWGEYTNRRFGKQETKKKLSLGSDLPRTRLMHFRCLLRIDLSHSQALNGPGC